MKPICPTLTCRYRGQGGLLPGLSTIWLSTGLDEGAPQEGRCCLPKGLRGHGSLHLGSSQHVWLHAAQCLGPTGVQGRWKCCGGRTLRKTGADQRGGSRAASAGMRASSMPWPERNPTPSPAAVVVDKGSQQWNRQGEGSHARSAQLLARRVASGRAVLAAALDCRCCAPAFVPRSRMTALDSLT